MRVQAGRVTWLVGCVKEGCFKDAYKAMDGDTIGNERTIDNGRTIGNERTIPARAGSDIGHIDQYELLKELGGGGFGTVYLAKDTVSGIEVAVKGLPPFVRNNREEMENIRSNFALVSRLTHTNIAKALVLHPAKEVAYVSEDVHKKLRVDSGDTLMVMEYAPGVTLSQWRRQFPDRKVPFYQALEVTRQIASALDYAHERRIVHRDIKPANVMIETAEDGSVTVRVLDFGLAAEIRSSMGRVSREIHDTSGTRPYMAPEQWLGAKQGPATDQYSLAALFCELVTGDVPFASVFDTGDPVVMMNVVGSRPFAAPGDLPKTVRLALSRALAKKPEERFASCGEFMAALEGKAFSRKERKGNKGGASGNGGSGKIVAAVALVAVMAGAGYFGWVKYDEGVRAREAEMARIAAEKAAEAKRIKQEVYELKGKASQAREKNAKEEWHKWPHFGVKAKELEGAFRAGEAAFAKDDFEVARMQFLKVRDNWYWLNSNKVERAKAVAMRQKIDAAKHGAESAGAAKLDTENYAIATNIVNVAVCKFDDGKFFDAIAKFGEALSVFETTTSVAKAKTEADRKAKEAFEKQAAERLAAAERKGREDAERIRLKNIESKENTWKECLKLKLSVTEQEREEITDSIFFEVERGMFFNSSFEDCRKADWNNSHVLYLLGKRTEVNSDGWKANERMALAFYEKSVELGCTNAIPEIERINARLAIKPYFDVVEAGDVRKIRVLINESNPCLGITNANGNTLMYQAALFGDVTVLEYLNSLGHEYNEEGKAGMTPLFAACSNTNGANAVSCLKWLVSKGVDVNTPNYKAGEYADPYPVLGVRTLQAFNYLLDKGVNAKVKGGHGNTLLHKVARDANDFSLVLKVVGMFKDVDVLNDDGETPLHCAVIGKADCAKKTVGLLVDHGADVKATVKSGYMKGYQPLHLAVRFASTERSKKICKDLIYELCRVGADVNAYTSLDGRLYEGVTPLMLAAKDGNVIAVKELLARGADVSIRSRKYNKGYTALHMVDGSNQDDYMLVEALCFGGCNIDSIVEGNGYHDGYTVLHLVCNDGDRGTRTRRLVRSILAKGAAKEKLTVGGTFKGYTPLGLACKNANYSAVKVLLEGGCDVSAVSGEDRMQPIHMIAQKDHTYMFNGKSLYRVEDIIKCLIKHGADINAQLVGGKHTFLSGMTPLHVAAGYSSPSPVDVLIKYGAVVDAEDNAGNTPLCMACNVSSHNKKSKLEKIKVLIAYGADPNHRRKDGKLLLSMVRDADVRKILVDAGAKANPISVASSASRPVASNEKPRENDAFNGQHKKSSNTSVLPAAARKLVGKWSCYCTVTYHDSLGSRADDTIKKYLPVSSTISLICNEDGTVELSDSSGRTFGTSRGKWKYKHGMFLMDLKSEDGRTFTLGGTVNWQGDSFELHYDNSEFANMIRKSCERQITDINAVLSSYVDGQLEVSISTKTPSFKIGHARCTPHVFSRQ